MVRIMPDISKYDTEQIYCRRLGHHLSFSYCRSEKESLPCASLKNCWYYRIPVDEFLSANFKSDEIGYIEAPPVPKIHTILEIIQQVKQQDVSK